ncbi:GDSL-type esterase/lipase family protein [Bacillus sp. S/N-304-OC-R1]|uniref:GDSL-type esterase/lipase family protein n=1 Tax=Bacillus sp. S/N-304-OC-R1 TaxID=2758034 RepID=UPI001C8EC654|nr:GDSL-type esterase/lipase family protein [Bacillus sp. S/N-304-OC-R1]MBY0123589.1 spore gernimation protein [Bacillus sp. S/N-304-OC-R1]
MGYNHLRYLALGDSLTVGVGVPLFDPGFVEYYSCLSQETLNTSIPYCKFAKSGATTGDVLTMISSPPVTEALKFANIITITAGGDDLINAAFGFLKNKNEDTFSQTLEQSRIHYAKILERIHQIDKQDQYIIRIMNLYNPFPEISIAEKGIEAFNSMISRFGQDKYTEVADIYSVFKGNEKEFLARGGVHPNNRGYYQMALAFHRLGYSPLDR